MESADDGSLKGRPHLPLRHDARGVASLGLDMPDVAVRWAEGANVRQRVAHFDELLSRCQMSISVGGLWSGFWYGSFA